jgi:outer membrane protein assembly factor BamB
MARRLTVLCACIATVLTPTSAASASGPACSTGGWPQFGQTASRGGVAPSGTRIGRSSIRRLRRVWRASLGNTGSPDAVGLGPSLIELCGVVYVAAYDGRVYAFDASSGRRLWRTEAVPGSFWGVAISHGTLLASANDGALYAYAAETGNPLWSRRFASHLAGAATTAPLVIGNTVYVMSAPAQLNALDVVSGAQRWSRPVGKSHFLSAPAAASGMIYVGVDHSLVAIDAVTGAIRWSGETGDAVWSTPTVRGGSVYVGSNDHRVYAFDAASGAIEWTAPTGDRVYTSAPVAFDGDVYVGSLDRQVHAFDAATGAVRWSFLTAGEVTGSPAVAGGVVFIGSQDGKLYALDAVTGAPLWSDALDAPVGSSPAIGAQSVYVTTARALVAYRV